VERIAAALHVSLAELEGIPPRNPDALTNRQPAQPSSVVEKINRSIPLVGEIRAGAWTEIHGETVEEWVPVFLPDYQRASLFALRVVGKSMDLLYREGCIVVVVPTAEIGLQVGDIVVVRRHKNGLVETTLKEITQEPGGAYILQPRSTDPSFPAIPLPPHNEHADDGAEIIGVVVYSIEPGRRGRGPLVTFSDPQGETP
jgi:SOS-response transcriptional repressor LexA